MNSFALCLLYVAALPGAETAVLADGGRIVAQRHENAGPRIRLFTRAVSGSGALGLMQVMPSTASWFGLDARIPEQNIVAGTLYLKYLIDKYKGSRDSLRRAIAAYNAGPKAVDKHRGVPPYKETHTYLQKVLAYLREYRKGPA
jgi:soluble lytic murein transglycosylase-like protein